MTDDEQNRLEAVLAEALGHGAFEAFSEVAGGIIQRDLMERGLGGVDPADLDPDLAGRLLLAAWTEAAVQCFPDRKPAEIVDLLARVVDQHTEDKPEPQGALAALH